MPVTIQQIKAVLYMPAVVYESFVPGPGGRSISGRAKVVPAPAKDWKTPAIEFTGSIPGRERRHLYIKPDIESMALSVSQGQAVFNLTQGSYSVYGDYEGFKELRDFVFLSW